MMTYPITIVEPQIQRLVGGGLSRLYRPLGQLARLRPGDRLWVREPYHLGREFDHVSPTTAFARHATPYFAADLGAEAHRIGRRRFGRELLRVWHRQHLIVEAIEQAPIAQISDEEIEAQGYSGRGAYALAWNRNLSLAGKHHSWDRNPVALVISFSRMAEPVAAQ